MKDKEDFKVSVIMPVYNAVKYVEEAVKSAVDLEEVGEIILIEDGSKDGSLVVCEVLSKKYEKVKLYVHDGNVNKGASESRNFGITRAQFDYISFLDADDVYCNTRFALEKSVFLSESTIDGVYSAVGYLGEPNGKMFAIKKTIAPHKLFHFLLRGTYGHFHTNGITVKRTIFQEIGFFNKNLVLHQDTEMWYRMAFSKILVSGEQHKPVALIRRHEGNRIWTGQSNKTRLLLYNTFLDWIITKNISLVDLFILDYKIANFESKCDKKFFYGVFVKQLIGSLKRKYLKRK